MKSAPTHRRLGALVPAAGRGSRLGADVPKVFVPILPGLTIWDSIHRQISRVSDAIVLVLSPEGADYLEKHGAEFSPARLAQTRIAVQPVPRGMGDAIFGAADFWRDFDDLLIVWGDQFNVSLETLRSCIELHSRRTGPALTLPVVRSPQPYVEYLFDAAGRLTQVRQSREGDACAAGGFSDIGVFLLSGGKALVEEWERYLAQGNPGSTTGEVNFLPFLAHLSSAAHWPVNRHECADPAEAIGINTPEELAFARQLLQKKSHE
jgi:bifunctional N-acetylglucosamine-1-phosphate-uridyltransferase/glucosamine-1-phosphate-acetyltransferase GlmU-like protein